MRKVGKCDRSEEESRASASTILCHPRFIHHLNKPTIHLLGPPASCLYLRGLSLHPGQCSCRPHDTGLGDSDSASNAPSLPAYRHCCGVRVLGVSCQSHTCSSFTLPFCCPVDSTNLDNHYTKYLMYRIWISFNHDHLGHTTGSQPPSEFGYIPVLDWVRRMKPSMH